MCVRVSVVIESTSLFVDPGRLYTIMIIMI